MSIAVPENSDFLKVHVHRFAKEHDLSNAKFDYCVITKDGDNYLGKPYSVKIEGQKNGDLKKFNLIFKCAPRDKDLEESLGVKHLYIREISFYEEKLPVFASLLKEYNLSIRDIPRYYGGSTVSGNEVLILEDLRSYGASMKKSVIMDYSHASLAIRHLGRFHAYSFALRDQKPTLFENIKLIKEPFYKNLDKFSETYDILCNVAIKAIESEGPKYIDRLREFKKSIPKLIDFVIDGRNAEPYTVLNHGDYWTNNILFKYNDDGQPEDLFFLDFQAHRYASPALDISYMLFNCCTPEMRIKHYDELLHQYHNSLAQCLKELGSDVEKLFPFEMLLEQLRQFAIYGGITGMLFLHLFTRQEGESPKLPFDIEYIKTLTKTLKNNCLYSSMMTGTFKDMVDKNYIS
ncbi:uncharacterized protein LOC117182665 [Belonocnema kinseyi]|uniref:uncharacterized protein LOC117182665 n=1 Tax=Belonocnema kinseyi TaxID=2817044 RepID=UPI00143DC837|nr:uncharacterized protein LOC117182665 [Belonocnema kinseyi]